MNISIFQRNDKLVIRLLDKVKTAGNKFKSRVLKNFGTVPKDLTFGSNEGKELIENIATTVQTEEKEKLVNEKIVDPKFYEDLLNHQLQDREQTETINLGILIVKKLTDLFNLESFFNQCQKKTKRGYNLFKMFLLIVAREIIAPGSLLNYYQSQWYYSKFFLEEELPEQDFYDFLTFFYSIRFEIQRFIFKTIIHFLGKRQLHIFYYDGTNFYVESTKVDEDSLDPLDQKVKKGLRQFGVSKEEKRNNVLVALGIIASRYGIPLFFSVFPGSDQEISHIYSDLKQLNTALGEFKIIDSYLLCSDAGLYSNKLVFQISGENKEIAQGFSRENNAYILGRGVAQTDQQTQKWARKLKGYIPIQLKKRGISFHIGKKRKITYMKSRVVFKKMKITLSNGRTKTIKVRQKQIALYSVKREYGALKKIEREVQKAREAEDNNKKLSTKLKKKISKYSDVYGFNDKTGELFLNFKSVTNEDEIKKDIDNAGLFLIVTSEVTTPDAKIINIYRRKVSIENVFHELKSVIRARPMYVRTRAHITAHLDLAVISLILLNMLKTFLKFNGLNLSDSRIQHALTGFNAIPLGLDEYILTGINQKIKTILSLFNIYFENPVNSRKKLISVFKSKMKNFVCTNK